MGSESDLEELHNSILSLCEDESQSKTPDQTLNLSPIKANEASLVDTPSTKDAVDDKCTPSILGPHLSKVDRIFTMRAHSTPIVPKRLCPIAASASLDKECATSTEEVEEDGDPEDAELEELRKMKYEDLLSEVTVLCGLPRNSLLGSEGPSKLKMEDSLKNLNQTLLSKINMDSILSQSYITKDKQTTGEVASTEDSKLEEKTPGRFADLSTTTPVVSLLLEDDDEEVELAEDILGLDEFIYSQLDSDDNFDEETLLFGEDTVVTDKTVKNFSKVEVEASSKEDLDSAKKSLHLAQNDYIVIDSTSDSENNHSTESATSKTSSATTTYADFNANVVCSGQKRKDNDLEKDEHDSKKSKVSNAKKVVTAEGISEKGFEKDETGSDVEYVVISLIDSSESDLDGKSDKEDTDITLRADDSEKSQPSTARKGHIPTVCVSPLIKNKILQNECDYRSSQAKEGYCSEIDYTGNKERSFLKDENELTRSVMRRWNSNGIHNPDSNLTHATTFRRKSNGMKGRLEGFHLSTLHGENSDENFRRNSELNTRSLTDCIRKLKMDMMELERNHFDCLQDMKCIFRSKMVEKDSVDRNRIRHLRCQQEMEVRSVHYQYVDPTVKRCQLMQLKMDHMAQIDHLQCIALRDDEFMREEYSRKVEAERNRFEEQYNKISSLAQQLSRREFEEKDDQFGPHIMVNLVKAPCIASNEKKTQVSVCLPLEIANAILKEDELYDRFYEYKV